MSENRHRKEYLCWIDSSGIVRLAGTCHKDYPATAGHCLDWALGHYSMGESNKTRLHPIVETTGYN